MAGAVGFGRNASSFATSGVGDLAGGLDAPDRCASSECFPTAGTALTGTDGGSGVGAVGLTLWPAAFEVASVVLGSVWQLLGRGGRAPLRAQMSDHMGTAGGTVEACA